MFLEIILELAEAFCDFTAEILPVKLRCFSFDCDEFRLVIMFRGFIIKAQVAIERHSFDVWTSFISAKEDHFLASAAGAVLLLLNTLNKILSGGLAHL